MTRPLLKNEVGWEYLSQQQRAFAEAWVITHHFRKALDAAGYTGYDPQRPSTFAKRILRRCKRYIDYLESQALQRTMLSVEAVQAQLARLGFSNMLNYYTVTPKGTRRPKTLEELSYEEAAAIKEWSYTVWKDDDGKDLLVLGEIKLHDARGPLQDLLKSLGGLPTGRPGETPPPQLPASGIDFQKLSPQEVQLMHGLMKKAVGALDVARDSQALSPGVEGQRPDAPSVRGLPPALPPPGYKGTR